jgi:hypothetical protein
MRIDTFEQLKQWNLCWPNQDRPSELSAAGIAEALRGSPSAIGVYWIGYSLGTHASFQPKYCGKAVLQPLIARLGQHVRDSHNRHIKDHLGSRRCQKPKIWFRFVELATPQLANFVEGMMIAAFREEYIWNRRNEWVQHWALETG